MCFISIALVLEVYMKRKIFGFAAFIIVLMSVLAFSSCHIEYHGDNSKDECRVIVRNNSSRDYCGTVWTEKKELFDGTIRAWSSKTFYVSDDCTVYTYFKSTCGSYNAYPKGKANSHKTLILEL